MPSFSWPICAPVIVPVAAGHPATFGTGMATPAEWAVAEPTELVAVTVQINVVQAPPLQICPLMHAMPHPPQLWVSVFVLTSQPSALLPLQSWKPGLQVPMAQPPWAHMAVALGGGAHS